MAKKKASKKKASKKAITKMGEPVEKVNHRGIITDYVAKNFRMRPSQKSIAEVLGVSQPAVSQVMSYNGCGYMKRYEPMFLVENLASTTRMSAQLISDKTGVRVNMVHRIIDSVERPPEREISVPNATPEAFLEKLCEDFEGVDINSSNELRLWCYEAAAAVDKHNVIQIDSNCVILLSDVLNKLLSEFVH